MFCPTRFVVDATENSKEGGVAAEVYSPQTAFRHLCTHVYVRTMYTTKNTRAKNKNETTP